MELDLHCDAVSGYGPTCLAWLQNLDGVPLYYIQRNVRHPLGAYNVSLEPIGKNFQLVLNELEKISPPTPNENVGEALLESYQRLIYSIMEHFEACEKIGESFYPPQIKIKSATAYCQFISRIVGYRTHVAKQVNAIKHDQSRLHIVWLSNLLQSAYGYFVASPVDNGAIGPNRHIHRKYGDVLTAFSFNREIRVLFLSVYAVGFYLENFLRDIGVNEPSEIKEKCVVDFLGIGRRVAALPRVYFPDEVVRNNPLIEIQDNDSYVIMRLNTDSLSSKPIAISGSMQVVNCFKGDGVTKSFQMPYFRVR